MPAYVIFHDATLREIAATRPSSLAELGDVSGVGETKLAKYGQQVLDTVPRPHGGAGPGRVIAYRGAAGCTGWFPSS